MRPYEPDVGSRVPIVSAAAAPLLVRKALQQVPCREGERQ